MARWDDWRRRGQEKYLSGHTFVHRAYTAWSETWEHDHCEFCGDKLSLDPGDLHVGWETRGGYHWICEACFQDFRTEFDLRESTNAT